MSSFFYINWLLYLTWVYYIAKPLKSSDYLKLLSWTDFRTKPFERIQLWNRLYKYSSRLLHIHVVSGCLAWHYYESPKGEKDDDKVVSTRIWPLKCTSRPINHGSNRVQPANQPTREESSVGSLGTCLKVDKVVQMANMTSWKVLGYDVESRRR